MTTLLDDAFAQHAWATLLLIEGCRSLTREQLETEIPGTYGSILATMQHMVGGDSWYLWHFTNDRAHLIDEFEMDLEQLRAVIEANGELWSRILADDPDPEENVHDEDEDGYRRDAPVGIRFAQALHHGVEHRSQICTGLTILGVDPREIDVWTYGAATGRVLDIPPAGEPGSGST